MSCESIEYITPCLEGTMEINDYDYLRSKSLDYIYFMDQLVNSEDYPYEAEIPVLFVSNLQKIANGKILLEEREDLTAQLLNAKDKCGKADITLLKTVVSTHDHTSTILFKFKTEKIGTYTTMAMLHFDKSGQIDVVNEVFNIYNDGW